MTVSDCPVPRATPAPEHNGPSAKTAGLDLRFPMRRMRAARRTEFLDHELLGLLLLVLASRVVAPFATIARQSYQISHRSLIASLPIEPRICGPEDQSGARAATIVRFCKPTTGFEPVTSSLPRKCSTD
jgi:hypothetical protein